MNRPDGFSPDWASPPGETISDILETRNIQLDAFAQKIGWSDLEASALIAGTITITSEIAQTLANALGPSASFWIIRESQYRADLGRPGRSAPGPQSPRLLPTASRRPERLSLSTPRMAAFRTSPSFESQPRAVAEWLKQGEGKSAALNCMPWNPDKLKAELPTLRSMSRIKEPTAFLPELRDHCAACGVAVVIARTPTGCRASGATRFLTPQKAMILLSFRYLSDDQFWFTFFHETGHLLLHGINNLFIEGVPSMSEADEREANIFSERVLIPDSHRKSFESLKLGARSIAAFAKEIGISPGIVVGQLQHFGKLPRKHFNGLKVQYDWDRLGL
jgi:HTH-type transcriptional regulator/antitoxin HigA